MSPKVVLIKFLTVSVYREQIFELNCIFSGGEVKDNASLVPVVSSSISIETDRYCTYIYSIEMIFSDIDEDSILNHPFSVQFIIWEGKFS